MRSRLAVLLGSAAVAVTVGSGCSILEPRPDPTRYYVLHAAADRPASTAEPRQLTVGLGPINLPAYLDRPQIVRRLGANRVEVAEFERWAEPLRSAVPRILGRNLESPDRFGRTVAYPWPVGTPLDLAVEVELTRFEASGSNAELVAHWTIRRGKERLLSRDSWIERPTADSSTEAAVAALSETLDALAAEIASAGRGVAAGKR